VLMDSFRGKIVRRLGTPQTLPKDDEPRTDLTAGAFSPDDSLSPSELAYTGPANVFLWL